MFDHPGIYSLYWDYFGSLQFIPLDEYIETDRVFCLLCLEQKKIENSKVCIEQFRRDSSFNANTSTGNGLKHLRSKHDVSSNVTLKENDEKISMLRGSGECEKTQELFDLKITEMIVASYSSFNFLSILEVRDLFETFVPEFKLREAGQEATAGLNELFDQTYTGIRRFFIQTEEINAVTLSFDIHHLKVKKSTFLGINVHFLHKGEMNALLLAYQPLQGFKHADDLHPIISAKVNEFGLEKKHICYSTDDGANLISTVNTLNKMRSPCIVHRLSNFIGKDLKQTDAVFQSITTRLLSIHQKLVYHADLLKRENLLIVKELDDLDQKLFEEELCELDVDDSDQDELDFGVETSTEESTTLKKFSTIRFHSVKFLFESCVRNKLFIGQALLELQEIERYPSEHIWNLVEKYSAFLKRVHDLSLQLSFSQKTTIHLVLLIRSEISSMIDQSELFDQSTKQALYEKFERRIPILDVHVAGSLLHPNMKHLKAIDTYLNSKNLTKSQFLTEFATSFEIDFGSTSTLTICFMANCLRSENLTSSLSCQSTSKEMSVTGFWL